VGGDSESEEAGDDDKEDDEDDDDEDEETVKGIAFETPSGVGVVDKLPLLMLRELCSSESLAMDDIRKERWFEVGGSVLSFGSNSSSRIDQCC